MTRDTPDVLHPPMHIMKPQVKEMFCFDLRHAVVGLPGSNVCSWVGVGRVLCISCTLHFNAN